MRMTLLVLALVIVGRVAAEAQIPVESLADLQMRVKTGDTVSVTDGSGQQTTGAFERLSDSTLSLLAGGQLRDIPITDIREVAKRGDSLWNGYRTGAGILGALVGLGAYTTSGNLSLAIGAGFVQGLTLGGGIGALIDYSVKGRTVVFRVKSTALRLEPGFSLDRRGVLSVLAVTASAQGQDHTSVGPVPAVGSRVRIASTAIQGRLKGVVVALDETVVTLATDGGPSVKIPLTSITALDASLGRKRNWLKGAAIGLGVGLIGGLTSPVDPNDCEVSSDNYCSRGAALGINFLGSGLVGAGIGALIKTDRWSGGTVARAQQSTSGDRRSGRSVAIGLFGSQNDLECVGCTSTGPDDPWRAGSGSGGFIALRGALSHQLLIGGEVNLSVAEGKRVVTIMQLLLTAQYFPVASRGFHVTAGVGPASFQIGGAGGGAESYGRAIRVGAGYDIAIGERFALTPFASVARTSSGNNLTSSGNAGPVTELKNRTVTQYGLAIVYGGR